METCANNERIVSRPDILFERDRTMVGRKRLSVGRVHSKGQIPITIENKLCSE